MGSNRAAWLQRWGVVVPPSLCLCLAFGQNKECPETHALLAFNSTPFRTDADLIILSLNGPSMEPLFLELAPYLRSDQAIVLLPAMGAVNYQQLKVAMRDAALRKDPTATAVHMPTYAATRTLPWACRVISPGRINLCGTKAGVPMCLAPGDTAEEAEAMSALLDSLFLGTSFQLNPNPIEQSFLPFDTLGNPVLHPGIMYGSWSEWDGQTYAQKRVFYHDVSEETVKVVESLQDEAKAVIAAYSSHLGLEKPPDITDLHADLYQCYSERIADPSTLYSLLRTNGAYEGIFHPMKQTEAGFVPDFSSRLLSEDVPCGLVAIRGVAQILGLETPWIDKVITWGQSKLGKEYLVDGKLIGKDINGTNCPQRFGIHSADELLITSQGAVAPHDHVHAEARPAQTLLRTLRTLPRISQSEK